MTATFSKQKCFIIRQLYVIVVFTFLIMESFAQEIHEKSPGFIPDFKERPEIKWLFKTNYPIYSSPIVHEGLVYFGGLDSLLHAIDLNSGIERWHFQTHGEIRSNVCIDGPRLYLNGGDGTLYALNKKTGETFWKFNTGGEKKYDFADYFQSTPVAENGILYFGSGDGNLYAVNSETGFLVWKFATGSIVHTTPALARNKVFFGSFDGHVYAVDQVNGNLIWKFKTLGHRYFPKGEVQGSPGFFNNLVIIGARDYNVYAIDQEHGYCHWNKAFIKGWGLNNNIHDSVLYIGSADERVLIAAAPETGREYWRKNMEFLVFGNCAYSETMLYLGTTIGKLHGINLHSGEKIWSFETDTYKENRFVYFKSDDTYRDDIYSIIRSNEQFLEVECKLGGIFSTPYIFGDYILFTSTNGILYCLER
jgi:outer membrane protein assembly factor BamB